MFKYEPIVYLIDKFDVNKIDSIKKNKAFKSGNYKVDIVDDNVGNEFLNNVVATLYLKDGKYHRENGAALIIREHNGRISSESYYIDGLLTNDNNPSYIQYHPNNGLASVQYYKSGLLHNEDGPAIIVYNENGDHIEEKYYVDGVLINNEYLPEINIGEYIFLKNVIIKKKYPFKNLIIKKLNSKVIYKLCS